MFWLWISRFGSRFVTDYPARAPYGASRSVRHPWSVRR